MRKLAPARVSYLNGFLISHRVNMCFPRLMTNMTTPSELTKTHALRTRSAISAADRFYIETSGLFGFT